MDVSGFMPRLIPTRSNFKVIMNSVYHLSRGITKLTKFTILLVDGVCLLETNQNFSDKKKILKAPGNQCVLEQSDIRPLTLSAIQL